MAEEKIVPNAAIGSSAENAYKGPETDRRGFISWLSFGWLAYIGVTGGFFTMIVRFLFPNVCLNLLKHLKLVTRMTFQKILWISSTKSNLMLGLSETRNQFLHCLLSVRTLDVRLIGCRWNQSSSVLVMAAGSE